MPIPRELLLPLDAIPQRKREGSNGELSLEKIQLLEKSCVDTFIFLGANLSGVSGAQAMAFELLCRQGKTPFPVFFKMHRFITEHPNLYVQMAIAANEGHEKKNHHLERIGEEPLKVREITPKMVETFLQTTKDIIGIAYEVFAAERVTDTYGALQDLLKVYQQELVIPVDTSELIQMAIERAFGGDKQILRIQGVAVDKVLYVLLQRYEAIWLSASANVDIDSHFY